MTITLGLILYALIAVGTSIGLRLWGNEATVCIGLGAIWPVVVGASVWGALAWCLDHIKPIREWRKK